MFKKTISMVGLLAVLGGVYANSLLAETVKQESIQAEVGASSQNTKISLA